MRTTFAIVLALVVAGCFGGGAGDADVSPTTTDTQSPSPKSTAEATLEKRPELEAAKKGAIEGVVQDEFQQRVPNAHVALLRTDAFHITDLSGSFKFTNLTAGEYTVRIDHEQFLSLEQKVMVHVGQATILNVTLVFPVESFPGFLGKPHRHDWWGDQKELVILDRYISMGTTGVCASVIVQNGCYVGFLVENTMPTKNYPESRIVFSSPPDENERPNIVFEGTGKLRVEITIEGNLVHPFDVRAAVPGETPSHRRVATVSTTKASFEIMVNETNTDPPHFRTSDWEFYIDPHRGSLNQPATVYQGKMHWKVTVYRSDRPLPVGGAHPDYWGGDTVRTLLEKTCDVTQTPAAYTGCSEVDLPENKTVTIGTAKMVVTLKWTQELAVPVKVGLEYVGADFTSNTYGAVWSRPKVTQDGDGKRVYEFSVRPDQWDSPYIYKSAWRFRHFIDSGLPNDQGAWDGTVSYQIEIFKQK